MSLFGFYMAHPPPGTTGATGLTAADNPWDAGRSTILRNNARHLVEVSTHRAVWSGVGVQGYYRAAIPQVLSGVTFTSAPTPDQIDWRRSSKTGGLALFLGHHFAWKGPLNRWPRLSCRFQVKVANTHTTGLVLCVAPGSRGPSSTTGYVSAAYTDTNFTEQELAFNMSDACFASEPWAPANGESTAPLDEYGTVRGFSVYLGGYVSSDSGSDPASVVGLTLALEIATP